jgi:hypothetical protein
MLLRATILENECTFNFENSIEVFVISSGSLNNKKESDNRQRERDMKETLEAWKRTSPEQFKQRVTEKQVRFVLFRDF